MCGMGSALLHSTLHSWFRTGSVQHSRPACMSRMASAAVGSRCEGLAGDTALRATATYLLYVADNPAVEDCVMSPPRSAQEAETDAQCYSG